MRVMLFFIGALFMSCSTNNDDMVRKGVVYIESQGLEEPEEWESNIQCYSGGCIIQPNGARFFRFDLESIETGDYSFGRGKKNYLNWLFSYESNGSDEIQGRLSIVTSNGKTVSGNFDIETKSRLNVGGIDRIRGEIRDVPIISWDNDYKGKAAGKIDGREISFFEIEEQNASEVHFWIMRRQPNEEIWLYINKDSTGVGKYELSKTDLVLSSQRPNIKYKKDGELYAGWLSNGSLDITREDESIGLIECELNCVLHHVTKEDSIAIDKMKFNIFHR